jgi:hypothetical protein
MPSIGRGPSAGGSLPYDVELRCSSGLGGIPSEANPEDATEFSASFIDGGLLLSGKRKRPILFVKRTEPDERDHPERASAAGVLGRYEHMKIGHGPVTNVVNERHALSLEVQVAFPAIQEHLEGCDLGRRGDAPGVLSRLDRKRSRDD